MLMTLSHCRLLPNLATICQAASIINVEYSATPLLDLIPEDFSDSLTLLLDTTTFLMFGYDESCFYHLPEYGIKYPLRFTGSTVSTEYTGNNRYHVFSFVFSSTTPISLANPVSLEEAEDTPITYPLLLSPTFSQSISCENVVTRGFPPNNFISFSLGYKERTLDVNNPYLPIYATYMRKYESTPDYETTPIKLVQIQEHIAYPIDRHIELSPEVLFPAYSDFVQSFAIPPYALYAVHFSHVLNPAESSSLRSYSVKWLYDDTVWKANGILRKHGFDYEGQGAMGANIAPTLGLPADAPRVLAQDTFALTLLGLGCLSFTDPGYVSDFGLYLAKTLVREDAYQISFSPHLEAQKEEYGCQVRIVFIREVPFSPLERPIFEILFRHTKTIIRPELRDINPTDFVITYSRHTSHVTAVIKNLPSLIRPYARFQLLDTMAEIPLYTHARAPETLAMQLPFPPNANTFTTHPYRVAFTLSQPYFRRPISILSAAPANISFFPHDSSSLHNPTPICYIEAYSHPFQIDTNASTEAIPPPVRFPLTYEITLTQTQNLPFFSASFSRGLLQSSSVTLAAHVPHVLVCEKATLAPAAGIPYIGVNLITKVLARKTATLARPLFSVAEATKIDLSTTEAKKRLQLLYRQAYLHSQPVRRESMETQMNTLCGVICLAAHVTGFEGLDPQFRIVIAPLGMAIQNSVEGVKKLDVGAPPLARALTRRDSNLISAFNVSTCNVWYSTLPLTKAKGGLLYSEVLNNMFGAPPPSYTDEDGISHLVFPHSILDTPFELIREPPLVSGPGSIAGQRLRFTFPPTFPNSATGLYIQCQGRFLDNMFSTVPSSGMYYPISLLVNSVIAETQLRLRYSRYNTVHAREILPTSQYARNIDVARSEVEGIELPYLAASYPTLVESNLYPRAPEYRQWVGMYNTRAVHVSISDIVVRPIQPDVTEVTAQMSQYTLHLTIPDFTQFLLMNAGIGRILDGTIQASREDILTHLRNMKEMKINVRSSLATAFHHLVIPNVPFVVEGAKATYHMKSASSSHTNVSVTSTTISTLILDNTSPSYFTDEWVLNEAYLSSIFLDVTEKVGKYTYAISFNVEEIISTFLDLEQEAYNRDISRDISQTHVSFLTRIRSIDTIAFRLSIPKVQTFHIPDILKILLRESILSLSPSLSATKRIHDFFGYMFLETSMEYTVSSKVHSFYLRYPEFDKIRRSKWVVDPCVNELNLPNYRSLFSHLPVNSDEKSVEWNQSWVFSNIFENAQRAWCAPDINIRAASIPSFLLTHNGDGTTVVSQKQSDQSESKTTRYWNALDTRTGTITPPVLTLIPQSAGLFTVHIDIQLPRVSESSRALLIWLLQFDFTLPKEAVVRGDLQCTLGPLEDATNSSELSPILLTASSTRELPNGLPARYTTISTTLPISATPLLKHFFRNHYILMSALTSLTTNLESSNLSELKNEIVENRNRNINSSAETTRRDLSQYDSPPAMRIACNGVALQASDKGLPTADPAELSLLIHAWGETFGFSNRVQFAGYNIPNIQQLIIPPTIKDTTPIMGEENRVNERNEIHESIQDEESVVVTKNNLTLLHTHVRSIAATESPKSLLGESIWHTFITPGEENIFGKETAGTKKFLRPGSLGSIRIALEKTNNVMMHGDEVSLFIPSRFLRQDFQHLGQHHEMNVTQCMAMANVPDNENANVSVEVKSTKIEPSGTLLVALTLQIPMDGKLSGVLPPKSNVYITCTNARVPSDPPLARFFVPLDLSSVFIKVTRFLKTSITRSIGHGLSMQPSTSIFTDPDSSSYFGHSMKVFSATPNDIRANAPLLFFNATIAPFHLPKNPLVEGNVIVATLPSSWIFNKLPENRRSCFFKFFNFYPDTLFSLNNVEAMSAYKMPFAPSSQRVLFKSLGEGASRVDMVAVEMGGIKSDDVSQIYPSLSLNFMDGISITDNSFHADALSLVCMSDSKFRINNDIDAPWESNATAYSATPLVVTREMNATVTTDGTISIYKNWDDFTQAIEIMEKQQSTVLSSALQDLVVHHAPDVETSDRIAVNPGWAARTVLLSSVRFLTASPLSPSAINILLWAVSRYYETHTTSEMDPDTKHLFRLSTFITSQKKETFFFWPNKIIHPSTSNHVSTFMPLSYDDIYGGTASITADTFVINLAFDLPAFSITEQKVRELIETALSSSFQDLANQIGIPIISDVSSGSIAIPASCFDYQYTAVDGIYGETDVDCGGETCWQCTKGKRCLWNSDCLSAACDKQTYTCVDMDQHIDDRKEHDKWNADQKPFDIFDKSPKIDVYTSILKTLALKWNIDIE